MEPVKEFYFGEQGELRERRYTIYYQEDEKPTQTSGGTIVRVRQIHYDQPAEKFPEVGPQK
jgi:hypothetical protein